MEKIIQVTQKPIIEYSIIEAASKDVDEKIQSLSLDTLEVSEKSLTSVKSIRAELSKDFKVFEEQRKLVKDIILKPYNEFEEKYKEMIATKFKDADKLLKEKIDIVADDILNKKIEGIKNYFEISNDFDFVKFEDLELKIIKSVSDKKLKDEIDLYLENIQTALITIETLENSDRVLAKFQMCKDLNTAISQTNIEIQREKQIEEQRLARIEAEKQKEQQRQEQLKKQSEVVVDAEVDQPNLFEEVQEKPKEEKVYKSTFVVTGTIEQLKALKQFMIENNIKYEGK